MNDQFQIHSKSVGTLLLGSCYSCLVAETKTE